jgi:tetratricopeptide (TPR) repeat protein
MINDIYKLTAIMIVTALAAGCATTTVEEHPALSTEAAPANLSENRYYYFTEAQLQRKKGNLNQAVYYLEKAIELDPTSVYLKKELVFLYLQMKKNDRAMALIEELLQDTPEDTDILAMYARVMQKERKLSQAVEAYEKVLDISPEKRNVYLILGGLYVQMDQLDRAIEVFSQLIEKFPDSYAGHLFLGKILLEKGEDAAAEHHLERALELESDMLEPRFELLRLYKSRAEGFREIVVEKGDAITGISLRLYGKYNADIEQAILKYNPGLTSVNDIREGQTLRFPGIGMIGDSPDSRELRTKIIRQYREILRERPKNIRAALELAEYYLHNGLDAEAARLLEELGRRSADEDEIVGSVAGFYLDEKNYADAAVILEGMLAGAPGSSDLHNAAGIAYYGLKENDKAISHFRQVQPDSRFYADAVIYAAFLYQESGRLDEAMQFLSEAVERSPDEPDFIYYLAVFNEDAENYAEARQILNQGIKDHPDNVKLHFRLGVIADKMGDKEACIEEMKIVIELDPQHANALNYLGYTYADLGRNLDEAESLIRKALTYAPDDGYITDSLGWVYYKKGKYAQALEYLKKAVELVPDDPIILEHLGDVYLKLGDKKKALKYYRLSLENENKEKDKLETKIRQLTDA